MKPFTIGAQLYIFQEKFDLERSLDVILEGLAQAGYGAVEGSPGQETDYRQELDRLGLRYIAPHVNPSKLKDLGAIAAYLRVMGGKDICSSGLLEWNRRAADDYRAAIRFLNEAGRQLRAQGIHLHYHNHEFEFERVEGDRTGMDLLLEGLDADATDLGLDVGWVWRAGLDTARFLREHRERIGYIHLRDFRGAESVPIGQGEMELAPIMDALHELPHLRWVVVEQDPTAPDPMQAMRDSRNYLKIHFGL